jgi:hypothetical protein
MALSGTYAWNPAASNLTLTAFGRIGIRRTELTTQHLSDAANEMNLLQVQLSNNQPNLWRSELVTLSLEQSEDEYTLPTRTAAIQDVFIRTESGGTVLDRIVFPLSSFEYDALPDKTTEAPPTCYYVNKTITPTIFFWQVPDADDTYTAYVRLLSQPQDALLSNGTNLDMPYRFLDVFVAGLAHRLSRIYAPDKEMARKLDYQEAWTAAARTDTQDSVSMYIQPGFSGYWR